MTISRYRKTRIIATLGPASDTLEKIEQLFLAGADIFRLNMSHGERKDKAILVDHIREIEKKYTRPIAIMVDLQGPKLRVGVFAGDGVVLKEGATFTLDQDPKEGRQSRVCLPHPELFSVMVSGTEILLNDGKVRLEVTSATNNKIKCKVMVGGELSDRKGVNVPNAVLPLAALTEKDRKDLDYALTLSIDWVALSFVQRPEDVAEAKAVIKGRVGVLAKIEKPAALTHLTEIIDIADAVMVARGDLGVEAPLEEVPLIQKHIIRQARAKGKPVVVATQMLESMILAPVPTRAEVSDVATAVFDDTDAIMLSAESAAGSYPIQSVETMDKVAKKIESDPAYIKTHSKTERHHNSKAEDAITAGAKQVATTIGAAAIVTFTNSGATAIRAARERPSTPILVLTPNQATARRLSLVWGLHVVKTDDVLSFEEMVEKAKKFAVRTKLAEAGDRIVITAGVPFGTPGATNVLHIAWV